MSKSLMAQAKRAAAEIYRNPKDGNLEKAKIQADRRRAFVTGAVWAKLATMGEGK